jgi:hypothetical protein
MPREIADRVPRSPGGTSDAVTAACAAARFQQETPRSFAPGAGDPLNLASRAASLRLTNSSCACIKSGTVARSAGRAPLRTNFDIRVGNPAPRAGQGMRSAALAESVIRSVRHSRLQRHIEPWGRIISRIGEIAGREGERCPLRWRVRDAGNRNIRQFRRAPVGSCRRCLRS